MIKKCGAIGGMRIGRRNGITRRKLAPVPFWPPEMPYDKTWGRTQAVTVGNQRLTAWAKARPPNECYSCIINISLPQIMNDHPLLPLLCTPTAVAGAKGSQSPPDSKIGAWVPWDEEPRITVLARASSNLLNCTGSCIPLSLLGNGPVNVFSRQWRIVGRVFYAVLVVAKESRRIFLTRTFLIIYFNLCLGFPSGLFPSGFLTNILHAFLILACVLCLSSLISSSC
jgi:hypothetical protein